MLNEMMVRFALY